jgi:hypothetical protein
MRHAARKADYAARKEIGTWRVKMRPVIAMRPR